MTPPHHTYVDRIDAALLPDEWDDFVLTSGKVDPFPWFRELGDVLASVQIVCCMISLMVHFVNIVVLKLKKKAMEVRPG